MSQCPRECLVHPSPCYHLSFGGGGGGGDCTQASDDLELQHLTYSPLPTPWASSSSHETGQ